VTAIKIKSHFFVKNKKKNDFVKIKKLILNYETVCTEFIFFIFTTYLIPNPHEIYYFLPWRIFCNLGSSLLGYAQFPGGTAATDGVVVNYTAFGTTGTAQSPFNLGRTATHEVGHWLNLRHIWGDANCGSDLVSDTPVCRCHSRSSVSYF
jgi:hypothetical protein